MRLIHLGKSIYWITVGMGEIKRDEEELRLCIENKANTFAMNTSLNNGIREINRHGRAKWSSWCY